MSCRELVVDGLLARRISSRAHSSLLVHPVRRYFALAGPNSSERRILEPSEQRKRFLLLPRRSPSSNLHLIPVPIEPPSELAGRGRRRSPLGAIVSLTIVSRCQRKTSDQVSQQAQANKDLPSPVLARAAHRWAGRGESPAAIYGTMAAPEAGQPADCGRARRFALPSLCVVFVAQHRARPLISMAAGELPLRAGVCLRASRLPVRAAQLWIAIDGLDQFFSSLVGPLWRRDGRRSRRSSLYGRRRPYLERPLYERPRPVAPATRPAASSLELELELEILVQAGLVVASATRAEPELGELRLQPTGPNSPTQLPVG